MNVLKIKINSLKAQIESKREENEEVEDVVSFDEESNAERIYDLKNHINSLKAEIESRMEENEEVEDVVSSNEEFNHGDAHQKRVYELRNKIESLNEMID